MTSIFSRITTCIRSWPFLFWIISAFYIVVYRKMLYFYWKPRAVHQAMYIAWYISHDEKCCSPVCFTIVFLAYNGHFIMLPVSKINMFFHEHFIIELKCHRYDVKDVNASNIFYNTKMTSTTVAGFFILLKMTWKCLNFKIMKALHHNIRYSIWLWITYTGCQECDIINHV
jgi:hypothetical protein